MGLFSFLKKLIHGVGRALGFVPSSAEKRARKSLLEEHRRSEETKMKEEVELKRKKDQMTSLRRSINSGRKSLLTSWYDEGTPEQTIGS